MALAVHVSREGLALGGELFEPSFEVRLFDGQQLFGPLQVLAIHVQRAGCRTGTAGRGAFAGQPLGQLVEFGFAALELGGPFSQSGVVRHRVVAAPHGGFPAAARFLLGQLPLAVVQLALATILFGLPLGQLGVAFVEPQPRGAELVFHRRQTRVELRFAMVDVGLLPLQMRRQLRGLQLHLVRRRGAWDLLRHPLASQLDGHCYRGLLAGTCLGHLVGAHVGHVDAGFGPRRRFTRVVMLLIVGHDCSGHTR